MEIPPSLSLSLNASSYNHDRNSGNSGGNSISGGKGEGNNGGGTNGGHIQTGERTKKRQGVIWGKDIRHFEGDNTAPSIFITPSRYTSYHITSLTPQHRPISSYPLALSFLRYSK